MDDLQAGGRRAGRGLPPRGQDATGPVAATRVDRDNPLGSYLRAHRERIDPADHGLPVASRRRVAGLRREELAELAGVGLTYYTRLEQGRDRHPSPSVLDALCRVLGVDPHGRAHLHRLCEPGPAPAGDGPAPERVGAGLATLVHRWTGQAAIVLGRYRDVLAANAMATALNPHFVPGCNLMREVFLDPGARARYPDWEQVAAEGAAALRASVGLGGHDPVRDELVADLCAGSAEFARLWARHDARAKPGGRQRFRRPPVGIVELHHEPLAVPEPGGQILSVFFAADGSADARKLAELARLGRRAG